MKFKSALVTQVSGSIGGATYARNSSGMYIRARSMPVQPNTAAQQIVKAAISDASGRWKGSDTAFVDNWNNYAAAVDWKNTLGDTIKLTGRAHYLRGAVAMLRAGIALPADYPTELYLPNNYVITVAGAIATQKVQITFTNTADWANETGAYMLVYQSMPKPPGRNFYNGPFLYCNKIAGNGSTPPTSPQSLDSVYELSPDNVVFVKTRIVRKDGRLSVDRVFRGTIS